MYDESCVETYQQIQIFVLISSSLIWSHLSTTLLILSLLCGRQSETCCPLRQHAVSDIHAPPSTLLKTAFEKDFLQLYYWPEIKRTLLLYFIYLYIVVVMCVNVCVHECNVS